MKQRQAFIDANVLISALDEGDVHHFEARKIWDEIHAQDANVFFSDLVLNEVLSVFAKRCEAKKRKDDFVVFASRLAELIAGYPILCLYQLLPNYYGETLKIMKQASGQLSFHDCLIVLFLKEVSEVELVTFDRDFDKTPVRLWNR